MTDDPNHVIAEIRSLQQSLTELQKQVIQGQIGPQEYQRIERERIQEIHKLEHKLAVLTGQAEPDRETEL